MNLQKYSKSSTYILVDPFDDPPQLVDLIPKSSPELTLAIERQEVEITAHERSTFIVVLEMIGDILEAKIKPPENVFFVCKINPITQEEYLEVIFYHFEKS
jgi:peptidyl-prolyl cis-trans isomerase-like 4